MKPSDLELQILSVLWERGPSTTRELLGQIPDGKERAYTSVLSMLQLMEKKGFVTRKREGLADRWRPVAGKGKVLGPYLGGLVRRLFGGSPSAALLQLLDSAPASEAELAEMERILREHRQKGGRK